MMTSSLRAFEWLREAADALDDIGVWGAERDSSQVRDDDAGVGVLEVGAAVPCAWAFDAAFGDGDGGIVAGLAQVEAEVEAGAGLFQRHD